MPRYFEGCLLLLANEDKTLVIMKDGEIHEHAL